VTPPGIEVSAASVTLQPPGVGITTRDELDGRTDDSAGASLGDEPGDNASDDAVIGIKPLPGAGLEVTTPIGGVRIGGLFGSDSSADEDAMADDDKGLDGFVLPSH